MRLNLLNTPKSQPPLIILLQQPPHKIRSNPRNHALFVPNFRQLNFPLLNITQNFLHSVRTEGSTSDHHLIGNDTETPPIYGRICEAGPIDYFWGDVVWGAD